MNGERNLPVVFSSDPAAIAAAAAVKARIQSAYEMALIKPRVFNTSRDEILAACKRPSFAKEVEFDRIQGKKKDPATGKLEDNHIQGLSIRFAEVALAAWGNAMGETQTIFEDENIRRVRISATDLEKNICFSHDIQISKTVERRSKKGREVVGERVNTYGDTVYIVIATAEEMQNKENALVSKTLRNEGLRLIPEDIKTEAKTIARKTILDKINEDPQGEKKKILDGFSGIGVKPKDLEEYLKHSLDTISPKELQELRLIYKAIHDGESTWNEYVSEDEDADAEVKKKLAELKKRKAEDANAPAGQEQGAGANQTKGYVDAVKGRGVETHDSDFTPPDGPPVSDTELSYFEREFKGTRSLFPGKLVNHIQNGKIKEATAEDIRALHKKWASSKETMDKPFPLDTPEDNPLKPETDPLKIPMTCPENSPTHWDTFNLAYCRKACGWPEKAVQCQPFMEANQGHQEQDVTEGEELS